MHNYQIPIIRFPLTVVIVEDSQSFLNYLTDKLRPFYRIIEVDNFNDAKKLFTTDEDDVLNCITATCNNNHNNIDLADRKKILGININFDNIIDLIDSEKKYNLKGILVTDYDLGKNSGNGLDLCQLISNKYLKKILLTGKLETIAGVDAMNKQIVDRYLMKDDPANNNDLHEFIETLHTAYFNNVVPIPQHVLKNSDLSVLDDPLYADIFYRAVKDENIKEFYLIDKKGSFVLINERNEKMVFNFHTEKSLNEFVQTYEAELDIKSLINAVNSRDLIPFFGIKNEPDDIELGNWHKYFYKPICEGGYYWNLIKL